jgi:hypothetical protein
MIRVRKEEHRVIGAFLRLPRGLALDPSRAHRLELPEVGDARLGSVSVPRLPQAALAFTRAPGARAFPALSLACRIRGLAAFSTPEP